MDNFSITVEGDKLLVEYRGANVGDFMKVIIEWADGQCREGIITTHEDFDDVTGELWGIRFGCSFEYFGEVEDILELRRAIEAVM